MIHLWLPTAVPEKSSEARMLVIPLLCVSFTVRGCGCPSSGLVISLFLLFVLSLYASKFFSVFVFVLPAPGVPSNCQAQKINDVEMPSRWLDPNPWPKNTCSLQGELTTPPSEGSQPAALSPRSTTLHCLSPLHCLAG